MDTKDNDNKKGGRKKLDNIISKLAEHQLNKTSKVLTEKNEDEDNGLSKSETTSESKRKSKRKPEKTLKASHKQENDEQPESNLTIVNALNSDEDIDEENNEDFVKEEWKASKKKRKKNGKNSQEDLPRVVNCSACNKDIHTKTGKLCRHPDLNTLICKKCYKFYSSGKFTKDEYGVEEYCRWCADGGDLICCDFCEKAFCKDCIKRNLGKSKLKKLLEAGEDEQWNCFCCDPDPISSKILLCNRVMHFLDEKKDRHTPYRDKKGREIIHGPNTSERRDLLTSISGEKTVKIEDTPETSFSKKTYSKRFHNGMNSTTDKNGQDSKATECIKKELNETEEGVTTVVSSEEEAKGAKKQQIKYELKKRNKASEKPKKSYGSKKKNVKEETGDSSSDEMAQSRTNCRGKISKTKSSKTKMLESDSENDFVSMVKKGGKKSKSGYGKKRKSSRRDTHSSEDTSCEESSIESSEGESSDASGKEKRKESKSRKRKVASSSSEKDESKSDGDDGEDDDDDDDQRKYVRQKANRNRKIEKKKGKTTKRWRLRGKSRKSEESDSDDISDEETPKKRNGKKRKGTKNKNQKKKKRKRKNDEEEKEEDTDEDEDEEDVSPSKRKGRKKIRKILDNEKLEEATKHARKLEEERRKRLVERTKHTSFEKPESVDLKDVVLEFNSDGETPLIEVDQDLVKHLKPHQVEGIKFMYDCTIESVKSWEKKEEEGAGCILAHVMGLGKTLQVITLVHTLYRSELIQLRRILVVSPLNTVLNWQVEFEKWLSVDDRLDVFVLNEAGSNNWNRADMLKRWHTYGGVLIIGYTMYRNLAQCLRVKSKHQKKIFKESLVDPGPELVVCDEGHILRNAKSAISIAMNSIKTKRRIVLTGTPLQNNLLEYHCMVSFVKPNFLGTLREFSNSFIHPIQNGQCADSTDSDVRLMKNRCHVLNKMLKGCVQRKDYADIAQFLPPKFEYVIKIRLSEKQREMYKYYLETFLTDEGGLRKGGSLFSDYQALMRIWTHPWSLKLETARQIERFIDTDDSMADFVVESDEDGSSSKEMSWTSESSSEDDKVQRGSRQPTETSSSSSENDKSDASEENEKNEQEAKSQSRTTNNSTRIKLDPDQPSTSSAIVDDDIIEVKPSVATEVATEKTADPHTSSTLRSGQEFKEEMIPEEEWYDKFLTEEDETNIEIGSKIVLLLEILADATALEEKVLIFSHSLVSLDLIEKALGGGQIGGNKVDWCRGCDYFRMDGSTSAQMRKRWADIFNEEENKAARVFLISTKAGGLGINLVGASRVIVFDISWNPSHDVQSIFRAYRFGQNKPVFVYRFIAEGTMEEKIYDRQVTKLSISQRVVDEHQIERHFNANDLAELYRFEPDILENENDERPTPAIPKDPILAELINRLYPKWIVKYHEHDSLLRNRPEEELSEAERKEAWDNYEAEKQGLNNRMPFMQNGIDVNLINAGMANAMNAGVTNPITNPVTNPMGVHIRLPNPPRFATTNLNLRALTVGGAPHLVQLQQQQQQQQQQRVLGEQRRRLFEYERQRAEMEKRREEELRKREAALRQMEVRRQEEIRARRAREHELEDRRQQIEIQQSRQFLQQLLNTRGNQNAFVTQPSGLRGYPGGQSTYRVVVNSAAHPQPPRRSPPRIIELPPDE